MTPWLSVGIGVGAIVLVVLIYAILNLRVNRRMGGHGIVHRSRLTCPKCGQTFDYEWVPGAAATAVRLGSSRYMACPLCHRWSTFNIVNTILPEGTAGPTPPPSP